MDFRAIIFFVVFGLAQCKNLDLTCQQIRIFVDGHNTRRLLLAKGEVAGQPAASEMKHMVWDAELAAKAEKWASQHKFQHNPDRTVGSKRFTTGENIYWFATTDHTYKLNMDMPMKSWFDEHKYYTYKPLSSSDFGGDKDIGHYTQMAWSNTVYVGCAVSQKIGTKWNEFLVVCNYGPAGNFLGQTPYQSGQPSRKLLCSIGDCSAPYGGKC